VRGASSCVSKQHHLKKVKEKEELSLFLIVTRFNAHLLKVSLGYVCCNIETHKLQDGLLKNVSGR
jgi:hypothetical protein